MNSKKTLVLGLLLIIIAGYFYFFEFRAGEQKEQVEEKAKKLFTLTQEDIKEITLKAEEGTIILTKDEEWRLKSPVSYRADKTEIGKILETLLAADKERVVEKNPADLTPFGLGRPGAEILVKTGKGETHTLFLGKDNPTEEFVYAKTAKDPEVFLINVSLKSDLLGKKAFDLRDKAIVPINAKETEKIDITAKNSPPIIAERDPQDGWLIKKPLTAKGDRQAIENLLVRFQNDKVKAFIDNPEDLSRYGLESPSRKIVFYQKDNKESDTLSIGKEDKAAKHFFARRDDLPTVFLIEKSLVEKLPKTANDLRDRTLVSFDRKNVTRIELIEDKKETIVLKKENNTWNIIEPAPTKADDLVVDNVLWVLENTKIKDFAGASKKPDAFGLKKPQKELKLWLEGRKEPESLLFGSTKNRNVYTKSADKDDVFLIESKLLPIFFLPLSELKERHIISFKEENITKVSVETPQEHYSLVKKDREWEFVMPPQKRRKIKEITMKELFWGLNDLRFIDMPEKAASPLPGKEKSLLSITLFKKEESKLETLSFFPFSDKDYLVLIRADVKKKTFFAQKKFLENLEKTLKKIFNPAE